MAGFTALCVLAFGSVGTQSGWASGTLANDTNNALTGALVFTHTYAGTTCAAGPRQSSPAADCQKSIASTAAASTTAASVNDTITDGSSLASGANLSEQVRVESCGPVAFANSRDSTNPMLPRYGAGFRTDGPWTGAWGATFDGSTAYAASITSQAQPNPLVSLGTTYGLGIWFRSTSTAGGPLFDINANPTNTAGSDDRLLYLNPNGSVSFIQNTSGATTTTSQTGYNNGKWHFAYVTMSAVSALGLGVTSTTTLQVDGDTAASGGGLLVGYTADTGYWHLGWSPHAKTGLTSDYFNGSLAGFVVFDGGNAPAAPSATQRASQSALTTWAASATESWPLDDSGTSTYASTIGYLTGGDPCAMDTLGVTLGSASGIPATTTLKAAVALGWGPASAHAAPAPGALETLTTAYARVSSGYDSNAAGLHLYAPLSYRVGLGAQPSTWTLTFRWAGDPTAVFIA